MITQDITRFEFDSQELRTATVDGETLFCGKDVALILGYKDTVNAIKLHCRGVVKRHPLETPGGTQEAVFITEPDLYRLIVNSKLPGAEIFGMFGGNGKVRIDCDGRERAIDTERLGNYGAAAWHSCSDGDCRGRAARGSASRVRGGCVCVGAGSAVEHFPSGSLSGVRQVKNLHLTPGGYTGNIRTVTGGLHPVRQVAKNKTVASANFPQSLTHSLEQTRRG